MKKLSQVSASASDTATQHILLSVSADGRAHAAGPDNMVIAMVGDAELYAKIKTLMQHSLTKEPVGYGNTHQLDYAPLSCSPYSPRWKVNS